MAAYLPIVFFGIYAGAYVVIVAATSTLFVLGAGVPSSGTTETPGQKKSRPDAMFYSMFPGIAHVYLRQFRRSVPFFGTYALVLIVVPLLFASPADWAALISSMIAALMALMFVSLVDAEVVCNRLRLPYTGDPYEIKITNYKLAYVSSLMSVWTIAMVTCIARSLRMPA